MVVVGGMTGSSTNVVVVVVVGTVVVVVEVGISSVSPFSPAASGAACQDSQAAEGEQCNVNDSEPRGSQHENTLHSFGVSNRNLVTRVP